MKKLNWVFRYMWFFTIAVVLYSISYKLFGWPQQIIRIAIMAPALTASRMAFDAYSHLRARVKA